MRRQHNEQGWIVLSYDLNRLLDEPVRRRERSPVK